MMRRKTAHFSQNFDVVTSVPSHYYRLFERGGNPPEQMARSLARSSGLPYSPNLLTRKKHASQKGKTRIGRVRNLSGAFAPSGSGAEGKNILLIDDVFTTGATVNACASILKKAGAKSVFVLTAARTVQNEAFLSASNRITPF